MNEWEIAELFKMDSKLEKIYNSFDENVGKTGPKISSLEIEKESSAFKLFFDEEIITYIKKESLDYMEKITKKEKEVKFGSRLYYLKNYEINNEDLYAYLALKIYMGILKLPKKEMYWSTSILYHNNFISSLMPKCYFKFIESSLHFVEINEEENKKNKDPRYKLGKILDLLNDKFNKYYILEQQITIDETIVNFKGTNSMKFYIPSKPHKWGFKLHLLSESSTGYTSKVLMDPGRKRENLIGNNDENISNNNEKILKSEKILLELLDNNYRYKGYHLYIDSWYTSITSIEKLQNLGFCVTGMISDNRINLGYFLEKNLQDKESLIFYNPKLKQNLVIHRDKRILKLITNYKYDIIDNGRRPYAIVDYSDNMHGVDFMNLKTSYYKIGDKSYKWYKYIFYRMVEISLENSRIIFNKVHNKKKTIFEFRENVMLQLLENYHKRRKGISNKVFLRNKHLVKFSFFHLPVKKNKFEFCKSCDCKITKNFCEDCKVFLCINCYKNYHINKFKIK